MTEEKLSESQAIDVCYEEFIRTVSWFCDGITAGYPTKEINKKKYAQYLLIEFARRIDREGK